MLGDTVVYALVVVPVEQLLLVEKMLGDVKVAFQGGKLDRIHCRELFHKDARRKTSWAHLNNDGAYELALRVTGALAGRGLMARIGASGEPREVSIRYCFHAKICAANSERNQQ